MSKTYHQLGVLAQDRRDYAEAQRRYEQSLEIDERLGDQPGMAISFAALGSLAAEYGDLSEAEHRYGQSIAIQERLGDSIELATRNQPRNSERTTGSLPGGDRT